MLDGLLRSPDSDRRLQAIREEICSKEALMLTLEAQVAQLRAEECALLSPHLLPYPTEPASNYSWLTSSPLRSDEGIFSLPKREAVSPVFPSPPSHHGRTGRSVVCLVAIFIKVVCGGIDLCILRHSLPH
jgi:hypothetical protein